MKAVSNPVVKLFSSFLLLAFFSNAHAYYLENALPGTVTVAVKGACAMPAFTAKAYYANIHTDERVLIGRGIVTASGKLIALEEKRSDVSYRHVRATGEKTASDYVDMVGDTLRNFLIASSTNCVIETLEPGVDSRAIYQWDDTGGKLNLKAVFGGHEKTRCFDGLNQERCLAQKIRGVIRFKGLW